MVSTFNEQNYKGYCDALAVTDVHFAKVLALYGYPPFWSRSNTFETLVHVILEQQVSLASALAALVKLKDKVGDITPHAVLKLTDEELKACYFSRQKAGYTRHLAQAIVTGQLKLDELPLLPDAEVRSRLTALKGIGNWTVDIYLLMVLHRTDVFPIGDLAIVNAMKRLKELPLTTGKEELMQLARLWQPHRSIAAMLLWHFYLSYNAALQNNSK